MSDFIKKLPSNDLKYNINEDGNSIRIDIDGSDTGRQNLIHHIRRGRTYYNMVINSSFYILHY